MSAADAAWEVHAYVGTMNAFINSASNSLGFGALHNHVANLRATQSIRNFFEEVSD
jgi:hypothetical protein